ncbi:MAG: XisI protein [Acidobacteria bacterium]|nr:XisI protein [Acidobacteriota bacterium]
MNFRSKQQLYRTLIEQVLRRHAQMTTEPPGSEALLVCDRTSDNYLLLDVGWDASGRVHDTLVHLHLLNGQVLIEKDGIEYGIAQDLQEAGIPAADLVTAWRAAPSKLRREAVAA